MLTRYSSYLVLFIMLSSTTVLFNNCGGLKAQNNQASGAEAATSFSGNLTAQLQYVSTDGRAWGYALDSKNTKNIIKVIFYANGPVGTGTYVGEINANVAAIGDYAGHFFSYTVPAAFSNGQLQKLYAYGFEARPENLIAPSPLSYASYTPKAEAIFNQNIQPFVSSNCMSCHAWNYKSLFYGPLMIPLSVSGGTATNNRFIRKMSGLEGHTGGKFCASVDSDICIDIQAWWRAEFQ